MRIRTEWVFDFEGAFCRHGDRIEIDEIRVLRNRKINKELWIYRKLIS